MHLLETVSMPRFGVLQIILLAISFEICKAEEQIDLTFPEDFYLGTASASYQVEGAWNISGKSENVWDHFVHNYPANIADRSTGDTTCDFYHKYKDDIKLVKDIGFRHFRFSISWSRIFPDGFVTEPNPKGVRFYHDILDELEKQGIIPVVTIYHWDHPQNLEKLGGWTNSYMAHVFADYAKFVFQEYGSRVKLFMTINEPQIFCDSAYAKTEYGPAANLSDLGRYLCVHNALKAHALAYHIYDKEFRSKQNGRVGIVLQCYYYYNKHQNDTEASDVAFEFNCGWVANPIFSATGDYPEIMKQRIEERSKLKGLSRSLLPTFSPKWIKLLRGSSDFFGLNHYTSHVVESLPKNEQQCWPTNEGVKHSFHPDWIRAESDWLYVVPQGFGDLLRKIKDKYGNPEVFVSECGASDASGTNDDLRLHYLYTYLKEMLIAVKRDQCNVTGFTIWSFLDSFEWNYGFTNHFGIVEVDFKSKNLTRTYKKSVYWLKTLINSRKLVQPTS